ncbi:MULTISPECIES: hypothetical protein [Luteimonas]|uniref:hypothetical protein n=1 Tax=Luteimonas TaxID=83614 RepID=UPI00117E780E|nr:MULTISPECIES: hypothetical protein [Luteimonas]
MIKLGQTRVAAGNHIGREFEGEIDHFETLSRAKPRGIVGMAAEQAARDLKLWVVGHGDP